MNLLPPSEAQRNAVPSRRLVGAIATVGSLALASVGLAFWSATGTGAAPASVGTVGALTASPGVAAVQIYPGGSSDVAVTVSNPNVFGVHVGSLSLDATHGTGGFGVDSSHSACDLSTLAFTSQSNAGAGWSVPRKVGSTNGSLAIDLAGALTMSAGAASACQGASFTVYVSAGP
ncbi:MAG TPA: hypothetical protein VIJ51_07370 [Solirubrobacteraceae bacterium]